MGVAVDGGGYALCIRAASFDLRKQQNFVLKKDEEKKKKHHMLTLEVVFCALRSSIAINKAAQFSCVHSHRVQSGQTCMEPKHTRNGNVR